MKAARSSLVSGAIGGAMLLASPAAALNPPGGGGPMAPAVNSTPDDEERDNRQRLDQELEQLDEMLTPGCANQQSNMCGRDRDEDEPYMPVVAPPTGSEGSSAVLPATGDRGDGPYAPDWTGGTPSGANQLECIGYECSAASEQVIEQANTTGDDAGVPSEGGYFNADYTGRSDMPPKSPGPGSADPSATQKVARDASGSGPGSGTGYFNPDYTGRSDVPPRTQGDDGKSEIPVNVTLVPVAIEPGDSQIHEYEEDDDEEEPDSDR